MGCIESSDDRREPYCSGRVDESATPFSRPLSPPIGTEVQHNHPVAQQDHSRLLTPPTGTEVQRNRPVATQKDHSSRPLSPPTGTAVHVAQKDHSSRQHGKAWRFYIMVQQPNTNNAGDGNCGISTSTTASAGSTASGEKRCVSTASESVAHLVAEAAANQPHFLLAESLPGQCDASYDAPPALQSASAPFLNICDVDGGKLAETPDPPHLSLSLSAAHHLAAEDTAVPATRASTGYVCFVSRTLPSDGDFVIRKKIQNQKGEASVK